MGSDSAAWSQAALWGSVVHLLSAMGSPFPSQQLCWPPGSAPPLSPPWAQGDQPPAGPTRATVGPSLPAHRQQPPNQPSALKEQQKGRPGGDQHTWQILPEGATSKPPSRGDQAESQGPTGERGFPWGELEKQRLQGLSPSLLPVLVCHGGLCARRASAQRPGQALAAGGH